MGEMPRHEEEDNRLRLMLIQLEKEKGRGNEGKGGGGRVTDVEGHLCSKGVEQCEVK